MYASPEMYGYGFVAYTRPSDDRPMYGPPYPTLKMYYCAACACGQRTPIAEPCWFCGELTTDTQPKWWPNAGASHTCRAGDLFDADELLVPEEAA